jgi:hypothetical protein
MSFTKFLVITIGNALYCKSHLNQLIPKLNTACYAVRTVKSIMSQNVLVTVYNAYFHSIKSYSVIFWSSSAYSSKIF